MMIMPPTRCFSLKRLLLRWCGAEVGENVRFASSVRFYLTGRLVVGKDTWIGHQVLIVGGDADIVIGERVDIAPRVSLVSGSHELLTVKDRAAGRGYSGPIHIGSGAWLGASSTVIAGTGITVGECSVVAAGSLVNRDIPPRVVVGGLPAKPLKLGAERVAA